MTTQNVERMLADQTVPPPPEGLVHQIKAEVPDVIELHPSLVQDPDVIPWHRRRDLRLAVAALFVVALTAVVSWQLRRQPLVQPQLADSRTAFPSALPEPEEASSRNETTRQSEERNEIPSRLEDVTTADAVREPPKDLRSVGKAETGVAARPVEAKEEPVLGYPDLDAAEETIEQAVERSFEGDVAVTGSLIPRADLTALSPVTVAQDNGPRPADTVKAKRDSELEKRNQKSTALRHFAAAQEVPAPSTGGATEPNDQPYGDVFFREAGVNPFIDTEDDRFSTFGLEVDTGSFNIVRRYLSDGHLPPREAVRVEEIVNAFNFGDAPPAEGDFALSAEGAASPFGEGRRYKIVRFGVTARAVDVADRPPAILTFVIDVSGSMNRENRLGLVKKALNQLLDNLREDDRVGLVVYGSRGQVLLEPSTDHEEIRSSIQRLSAGGSTNAEEGLVLAYELADRFSDGEYINRVILCSDGVANVGQTGPESILGRIKGFADNGIELTTVGFGMGNYNDVLMEQLADTGDGRYAYVDTLDEAKRLFVEELTGTLLTIGSEAKAQVEFNPEVVSRYRLLGYENRDIADERFRDPTVDAGEIGAGLTATAVYEIKLDEGVSRWSKADLATLRVRYRPYGSDKPVEIEHDLRARDLERTWEQASPSLRLASLVAEYAEILKGSYWAKTGDMNDVLRRARELAPEFEGDDRVADWIGLVEAAAELITDADEATLITD